MKKITSLLFAMMILSFVQAQSWWGNGIKGEGSVTTKTLDVGNFTGVVYSLSGEVNVTKGSTSFEVTAQPNIIDNLKLEVKDDVLYVGYKESVSNAKSPVINISMPSVKVLKLTGSGNMKARGFESSERLTLKMTGSGSLDVDSGGQEMEVKLSGSGNIRISGNASRGEFGITGSGNIRAKELNIQSAEARISGSGNIALACKGDINAKITGSGNIDVYGNPKVVSRVTGSGSVHEH